MLGNTVNSAQDFEDLVHIAEGGRSLLHLFKYVAKEGHTLAEDPRDVAIDGCTAQIGRDGSAQLAEVKSRELGGDTPTVAR